MAAASNMLPPESGRSESVWFLLGAGHSADVCCLMCDVVNREKTGERAKSVTSGDQENAGKINDLNW